MKGLSFLALLIGFVLLEEGVHAASTPINILNLTGRSYPRVFIYAYAADLPSATVVVHSQTISDAPNSVSNSIYSESGNFKGLAIKVEPMPGVEGPTCYNKNYPDTLPPLITITDSKTCTITSPVQSRS